jgi:hypothetical protein
LFFVVDEKLEWVVEDHEDRIRRWRFCGIRRSFTDQDCCNCSCLNTLLVNVNDGLLDDIVDNEISTIGNIFKHATKSSRSRREWSDDAKLGKSALDVIVGRFELELRE